MNAHQQKSKINKKCALICLNDHTISFMLVVSEIVQNFALYWYWHL